MPAFIKKNYTEKHNNGLPPMHPGYLLQVEFLEPLGLPAQVLADRIGVPHRHIRRVLAYDAPIDTDLAFRLARYFGMSIDFWLTFQQAYDVKVLEARKPVMTAIRQIKPHPKKDGALKLYAPSK
jgi:addiction module HigA family antidote